MADHGGRRPRSDAPAAKSDKPKLYPDPKKRSLRIPSPIPYGWDDQSRGRNVRQAAGLLEAKADIDFMFDENDELHGWISADSNPRIQMKRQRMRLVTPVAWSSGTRKPRKAIGV